jgi:preprotein translocase subunit SecF
MNAEELKQSGPEADSHRQKKIRYYKFMLIFTLSVLVLGMVYLAIFHAKTGEFMYKDVTLTGGVSLTVYTNSSINNAQITQEIINEIPSLIKSDILIRKITDIQTGKQLAVSIDAKISSEDDITKVKNALSGIFGFELNDANSNVEFTGATLGTSFYNELIKALLLAFLFMAIVIFLIFRNFIPSIAVILCAVTDIFLTLAIVNLIGLHLSMGGISAFLMLIGYSVDTDILLTTRVLKRREPGIEERHKSAIKTGLTETITSIASVLIGFFLVTSPMLKEVFLVLTIGLFIDMFGTWLQNASILRLYCYKKNIN